MLFWKEGEIPKLLLTRKAMGPVALRYRGAGSAVVGTKLESTALPQVMTSKIVKKCRCPFLHDGSCSCRRDLRDRCL